MKNRTVVSMVIVTLLLAVAATAQTYVPLYTYPETISNTTGVAAPALLSQGPDGELYSTIQSNGTYNSGSVYKMTTAGGAIRRSTASARKAALAWSPAMTPGAA